MFVFDPRPLLQAVHIANAMREQARVSREQQAHAVEHDRRMQRAYEDSSGMVIDVEMREVSIPALPDGSTP